MAENNSFLSQIGFENFDLGYLLIITAVLFVLFIVVMVLLILQIRKTNKLTKRLDKFLIGKNGMSLEQDIIGLFEDNKFLKTVTEKNKKDIRNLYKKSEHAFQKMSLVKYDAFNQMGGQLSFCLVLLDENNNGFIINSVYARDMNYSYMKEIVDGTCSLELSGEEEEALEKAKNNA